MNLEEQDITVLIGARRDAKGPKTKVRGEWKLIK